MQTEALVQYQNQNRLAEVIDRVLKQCLGEEAAQIIYNRLENHYLIQRSEIAERLDSLNQALEDYLGKGATIVEKAIIENM